MNYRHAYHAGNFADVVKHAVLALVIRRLQGKDTAFRLIDTHAGAGLYDLAGLEAGKTLEWQAGIGRLAAATVEPPLAGLLEPYLTAVRSLNEPGGLARYPGSPALARQLLRRQDRITAIELHPDDFRALRELFAGDVQVRTVELDGWLAAPAFVPPKERRGIVLIDPPYEAPSEFDRLAATFEKAHRRWPTGVYLLWYPIKDLAAVRAFKARLAASGIPRLLAAELTVEDPGRGGVFSGCGLMIANPPWQLADDLRTLLAGLVPILARDAGARSAVTEISGEQPAAAS